jgi:ABC-2 type transport system permease protein
MNTQTSTVPETLESQAVASVPAPVTHPLYWSVRRELWENRSIYIAPLVAAAIFLLGYLINLIKVRRGISAAVLDPTELHQLLYTRYEISASLIMGTAFIVGVFYTLDALYGERRDRSILFWKSLPVSDLTVVLSKVVVPSVILPLLSFIITIATQLVMLLLSGIVLAGSGVNIAGLWAETSFFHVSLVFLYHIVTVHGLWYAPIYGWLLLVSAWAPRAPFLWAFLPPFVVCGVEKLAFDTTYLLTILKERLTGPADSSMIAESEPADHMAQLIPHHFFSQPGLWIGLAIAVVFLFATVRLRRYRGPI